MVCDQCQGEEWSNESKSLIIDDIDGRNDRNVFDAFASFWQTNTDCFTILFIGSIYKKVYWLLLYHI